MSFNSDEQQSNLDVINPEYDEIPSGYISDDETNRDDQLQNEVDSGNAIQNETFMEKLKRKHYLLYVLIVVCFTIFELVSKLALPDEVIHSVPNSLLTSFMQSNESHHNTSVLM